MDDVARATRQSLERRSAEELGRMLVRTLQLDGLATDEPAKLFVHEVLVEKGVGDLPFMPSAWKVLPQDMTIADVVIRMTGPDASRFVPLVPSEVPEDLHAVYSDLRADGASMQDATTALLNVDS